MKKANTQSIFKVTRQTVRRVALLGMASTSIVAGTALAVPVTITGGFTNFESNVGGADVGITQVLNGAPLCAISGCANSGSAFFDFGTPQSSVAFQNFSPDPNPTNLIQFIPAATQEVSGVGPSNAFLLGTLTFQNGIWTGGATLGFTLTTHSSDALFDGHTYFDHIAMTATPNDFANGTPQANADFLYFVSDPGIGGLHAYELQDSPTGTNIVSANLYGYIGSLHLLGFGNATGGGFVDQSVSVTPAPTAVPEPASLAVFAAGLFGFVFVRRSVRRHS